jgi:hypothetical protein
MTNNTIIGDILEGICKARFLIADVTRYNPNVMYELGVAHALKKEVIIIYQKKIKELNKFPFDLSHIRSIWYVNDASGGQRMKENLSKTIEYVLSKAIPQVSTENRMDDKLNDDIKDMIRSQHEIRRNRIEYFTYHCLYNFVDFRKQHIDLLRRIRKFRDNHREERIIRLCLFYFGSDNLAINCLMICCCCKIKPMNNDSAENGSPLDLTALTQSSFS